MARSRTTAIARNIAGFLSLVELGSRAAWHYIIIHEGQVNSPREKEPSMCINL